MMTLRRLFFILNVTQMTYENTYFLLGDKIENRNVSRAVASCVPLNRLQRLY